MPEPTQIPAVTEIVHDRPPAGSGLMPCCGRSPAETPGDRQTTNPEMVTCGGGGACARCGHSEGEGCGCPPDAELRDRLEAALRPWLYEDTVDRVMTVIGPELQQLQAALAHIARLADEYPVHIDTALVLAAIDGQPRSCDCSPPPGGICVHDVSDPQEQP